MVDIELVEETIISALQTIPELKTVDGYQGGVDDALREVVKLPAAFVIYGGAAPEMKEGKNVKGMIIVTFYIYYIGMNLRGRSDVSLDVRRVLRRGREVLNGLRYEKIILRWQQESLEIITESRKCIYMQTYQYSDYLIA